MASNILRWAQVAVDIKVARFLKTISAWGFQGFSNKQFYLGSTNTSILLISSMNGKETGF